MTVDRPQNHKRVKVWIGTVSLTIGVVGVIVYLNWSGIKHETGPSQSNLLNAENAATAVSNELTETNTDSSKPIQNIPYSPPETAAGVSATRTTLFPPDVGGQAYPLQPFSNISPDGHWLSGYIQNTPQGPKDSQAIFLESTDGKEIVLQTNGAGSVIYGQTPDGALILGDDAGGGGVTLVYMPNRGTVRTFPMGDPRSHWTYSATQSQSGHWASIESNFQGGGPGKQTWTDVDGHKLNQPGYTAAMLWSPDGNTLAVVSEKGSMATLILYNASTRKERTLAGPYPLKSLASSWSSVSGPAPHIARLLAWSPTGRYLGWWSDHGLRIMDMKTGKPSPWILNGTSLDWGFTDTSQVYTIGTKAQAITIYAITDKGLQSTQRLPFHGDPPTNLWYVKADTFLRGDAKGAITLISPTRHKLLVQRTASKWWFDRITDKLFYVISPYQRPTKGAVYSIDLGRYLH